MVEHRVPVRNGALHRAVDPEHSPDPKVRALVGALAGLQVSPPPREHFRAELRAQLVAVAPRLVNEGMEGLVRHTPESYATAHVRPSRWHLVAVRLPKVRLGTPIRLVTAALAVLVLLASGAVWLSRSALPGDPLYNLKRASENAQLSLQSGTGKATELLDFAKTRVDEVADLLSIPSASGLSGQGPQADGAISPHTASLITSTLGSADDDLRQAANLIDTKAVRSHSTGPLKIMLNWAPDQQSRLDQIVEHIPAGTLHDRAATSSDLVAAAFSRAQALQDDMDCGCLNASGTDSLGPLPCTACEVVSPTIPTPGPTGSANPGITQSHTGTDSHGTPAGPKVGQGQSGAATNSGTGSGSAGDTHTPAGSGSPSSSPTSGLPLPSISVPTLPTIPPVLSTNSCGASVALGPIGIGVGTCGIQLHL
ncbi:MAG TPA: DUF5667 domain-containing protein [Jatrophihabitantaceae bacterium]|nr:DUF5667 domain-containing protein [Jatrophihabitantaceae bacterium]